MNRRELFRLIAAVGFGMALPVNGTRSKYLFKVLFSKCVGCRDCERICPVAAISFVRGKAVIDMESCNGCNLCYSACSYGAIKKCDIDKS